MEFVAFIQVFNIIVIAIGTLFYMCCRSLTFSSSSSSAVADCAAVADDEDADIPPRREKYDVFISFRGEDTRLGFTSHLHAALLQKKIETYIDNRLQRGEEIGPALRAAVEKSTISVIIFSQNYASSAWCLDEVVHILKCKERYGQMVIPVFYDINPSHVRKQHGSYADAFAQLEKRFENSIHKVHKWRDALTTAANLSGFDYSNKSGTEADLIQKVVDHIWIQLCRESSCDLNGFVGIESRIKQIELLLGIHSQDACITVGIWGMGGIGKTTLAEAVFRKHSSKFEASCFLKNVTENSEQAGGLDHLEKTLLKEILKEEVLPLGSTLVRERLSRTKVLIVLDDVSSPMQMERLAGDGLRYGPGSRIIITSRDRSILGQTVEKDYIYEVEVLKPDDALELFCSRAFKNNSTRRTDYKESAENVVQYARGVPLALTVLGSLFFNCKSKEDWEGEFNKLKQYPSESIQKVLRISYDKLGDHEKEIFLDIACFFKGRCVDWVSRMIHVRGLFAESGIRILIDMSLISIDSKWVKETIQMHDLLQEMGRTIVQEQFIEDPCKCKRLFNDEQVYHVLKSNTETPNVAAVVLDWRYMAERSLKRADFKVMSNLRLLIVYCDSTFNASLDLPDSLRFLEWCGYPLESLPSNFCPENLVELHMVNGKVKKLWKEEQILVNLQVIDLGGCSNLTEVPNLSGSLKIVKIILWNCISLVEIPSYFRLLDKLTHLDLRWCGNLKYLPEMPGSIQHLNLLGTGIKKLPESVWSNENFSYLNISFCNDLEKLQSNSCKLKASNVFGIASCTSLGEFSELPRDITKLSLVGCKRLVSLPNDICKLKYLEKLDLSWCSELENFPEILEPMEHLKFLNLSGTAVKFKWRDALTTAAMIKADLIQKVVDDIWIQLCRESSCDLNGFVGIEGPIKQIEWLLGIHSQRACITVCIWGMGGIGKTTLAEAVFRKHSSTFEASCFLKNVAKNSEQAGGLDHLEKTLLKEILKEEVLPVGSTSVRERLSRTKVLVVLDDVSSSMQMERLAGDRLRYGPGSRIIITSRDKRTLGQTVEDVHIYEVQVLNADDALQLFCSRAFKNNSTRRTDYKELAEKVELYARGVPLALTFLGLLFSYCKSKEDWEDEFNKLKRFPSESMLQVLGISDDRLTINEKEIFLDIACFFKGWSMDRVKRM